jgi:hypothetical protein
MMDQHTLSVYLNNHLAGASGGLELFRRAATQHAGTSRGVELRRLADEIEGDREALRDIMGRLGVKENRAMSALGWAAEKAGRLKPNGYLVRRSPLSDIIELEGLRVGVAAKMAGWQVLRAVAVHDSRLSKEALETLLERAEDQAERLYKLHLQAAQEQLDQADD